MEVLLYDSVCWSFCTDFIEWILSLYFIVEYAQIDWHDFAVVETISFREDEAGEWEEVNLMMGVAKSVDL